MSGGRNPPTLLANLQLYAHVADAKYIQYCAVVARQLAGLAQVNL